MENNYVITVARGFGCGGKRIAKQVSRELGIHFYENRILTLASQLSGLDETIFSEVNEKIREKGSFAGILGKLPKTKSYIARNEKFVYDQKLFDYQREIIENLADTESCVIVGKCADWILRDRPNVISLYIEAPRAYCIERTMENMKVDKAIANNTIIATDKFRSEYYSYYTHGQSWTNPVNYDLTLNSDRIGVDNCVALIKDYVKIKLPHVFEETDK